MPNNIWAYTRKSVNNVRHFGSRTTYRVLSFQDDLQHVHPEASS